MAQGYFGTWFVAKRGAVRAVLTGDHFYAGEEKDARDSERADAARALADKSSPMYLVPEAVVKTAYETGKGSAPLKLSSCRSGKGGKPCGKCGECERARDEFFDNMLLHAVDFGEDEFANRVKDAVASVLGSVSVSVPWAEPMDEEEVLELMNEMRGENG